MSISKCNHSWYALLSSQRLVTSNGGYFYATTMFMAIDKALTPSPWTIQMDYPKILNGLPENGLPLKILFRMSTIERTAIYILTLHVPCLFLSARPLAAILNNYTQ